MEMQEGFETFQIITDICRKITEDSSSVKLLRELKKYIENSSPTFIKVVEKRILASFYPYIKQISSDRTSFKNDEKLLIVETLKHLLDKLTTENSVIFFNFYSFLIFEIYDYNNHKVLEISEEYKLTILKCMISLCKSVSPDLVATLYINENAPKFSQIIYVAGELAKTEKSKELRCIAVECIMAVARVLDDNDFCDIIIRDHIAEVFKFFLPGLSSTFREIALEDVKVGHKIPLYAIRAFGKIVTLVMQDYDKSPDDKLDLQQIRISLIEKKPVSNKTNKWKSKEEIDRYLDSTKRSPKWYKDNDEKLQTVFIKFEKIAQHPHSKVRLELAEMASLIIENCNTTMPLSVSHLIETVIVLSQDEDKNVSEKSNAIVKKLSAQFSSDSLKILLENMEEGFYDGINCLPRKFNNVDDTEKVASLNLLIGYVNLLGAHNLTHVLLSAIHLNKLMTTLLHVSELEKTNVSLLEDYTVRDFDLKSDSKTPWINFRYFREESVKAALERLCSLLSEYGAFHIVSDFLLDTIMYDEEHRKEAIYLLNSIVAGLKYNENSDYIIKNIITTYTDNSFWHLPMFTTFDSEYSLGEIQNNVIQVALLVEGLGKIALALKEKYQEYLLRTLYLVLERAGSAHPLVRAAGLTALTNITTSCGYSNITDLINTNIDYFSYHVERKLNKAEENEAVLNVLTVVLKYSKMDVLYSIGEIINEVLMQSCDRFKQNNATAFLRVFKIFIECLRRWLNIEIKIEPIKSKAEKLKEIEDFKVTGINYEESFVNDVMEGKTAEEMYGEDIEKMKMEKKEETDEPQVEEYKKPDPPMHVKLTVAILSRSLHFLPSKDKHRKILVLQILSDGLEIIRDWEDELLPIVHQIWSPLVQRFKETEEPLIVNCSFRLLGTLARLSKDFIRMRTTKEVLPGTLLILDTFSKDSYLKDKGSAYRYTQRYKLQLEILENLGTTLVYLDTQEKHLNDCMDCFFKYLSDKQPIPLQKAALGFFKTVALYDVEPVRRKVNIWIKENSENEFAKNISLLDTVLREIRN